VTVGRREVSRGEEGGCVCFLGSGLDHLSDRPQQASTVKKDEGKGRVNGSKKAKASGFRLSKNVTG